MSKEKSSNTDFLRKKGMGPRTQPRQAPAPGYQPSSCGRSWRQCADVVEVLLENITVLLLEQTINYICIWICSDRCPTNCPRFLVSCLPLHLPYLHQILQRPPVLHQLLPLQVMFKLVPTWRRKILDVIKLIPYLCICHTCICHTCIRFHKIPPASTGSIAAEVNAGTRFVEVVSERSK